MFATRTARAPAVLLAAVVVGVAIPTTSARASSAAPGYVGIVVGGSYACVRWHAGISGDEVLNDVAEVHYRSSDHIIDAINGYPNPPHADVDHYWSYWHDTSGTWTYSSAGASGSYPTAGSVEGWSFDNGASTAPPPAADPAGLYTRICGAEQGSPAPSTRAAAPRASARPSAGPHRPGVSPAQGRATNRASSSASADSSSSSTAAAHASDSSPKSGPPAVHPVTSAIAVGGIEVPVGRSGAGAASTTLTPLHARRHTSSDGAGPALPTAIGVAAALLLGAAAAWAVRRRREPD